MTHILTAEKALKFVPVVSDYPTYILGTIAPDAVHANSDYTVEIKEKSHILAPGLKWGKIDDWEKAELWLDSIKKYYLKNRNKYHKDFLLGYIVHLLVDIYNSMYFYTPFIKSIKGDFEKTIEKYKKESYNVNYFLYSLYSEKKDLWNVLNSGKAVTLDNVIKKEDIEHRIVQLFEYEFKHWDISHIADHEICKIEDMEHSIQDACIFIKKVLVNEGFL